MDTPILLALISTGGVLVTGVASIMVAFITNRRESKNAAVDAADNAADEATRAQLAAKDERITLRDEQIQAKDLQLADCLGKSAAVQGELNVVLAELAEAREKVQDYAALQEELRQAKEQLQRCQTELAETRGNTDG